MMMADYSDALYGQDRIFDWFQNREFNFYFCKAASLVSSSYYREILSKLIGPHFLTEFCSLYGLNLKSSQLVEFMDLYDWSLRLTIDLFVPYFR